MSKDIKFGKKARKKLSKGVQKLTDAVSSTMGPMGKNVLIEREESKPHLTKDGVTVAHEVFFKDRIENMGAQIVKEVSANTAFEAGDGTTTSTVLANAIFQNGLKRLNEVNPVAMKRGMDKMVELVLEELKENSREISDEDIVNVATISANGDREIGELIAKAISEVGRNGIITVEEASGDKDELEVTKGFEFNRGYLSPHFITNSERERAELEDPFIMVVDGKVSQLITILPILEKVQKTQRPLLIIAEEVEGEALSSIIVNKMRGTLNVFAVKSPGFGLSKEEYLKDISLVTGATLVSKETGKSLEGLNLEDLGSADKVIITSGNTVIVSGHGDKEKIEEFVNKLESSKENSTDIKTIEKRIARITGSAATIKVGAQTEFEMAEKKDRFDDAVEATKSAISEGIVIGGGCALIHASKIHNPFSGDAGVGAEIVLESILEPFKKILENAGFTNQEEIIEGIRDEEPEMIGFNAVTGELEDLFESGVIDPLKVTRIALVNANSIASTLLTTEVSITK